MGSDSSCQHSSDKPSNFSIRVTPGAEIAWELGVQRNHPYKRQKAWTELPRIMAASRPNAELADPTA